MVETSSSIAGCTANFDPIVYLLSKKTALEKDYYPALLDEGLKPREGQGPAYRDRPRWMLSSFATLEVCQEDASSALTLTSFHGELGPELTCLNRLSVASRSKLPHAGPAWSTDVGAVVCQPSQPHLQRACSQARSKLSPPSPGFSPQDGSPPTAQPRKHCLKERYSSPGHLR